MPAMLKTTRISERAAKELLSTRVLAKAVLKALPAVLERNSPFMGAPQVALCKAGIDSVSALVPVLGDVYLGEGAPPADLSPQGVSAPLGGASPALKTLFRQIDRLTKDTKVAGLIPQLVSTRDAVSEMLKVTDLLPGYDERDPFTVKKDAGFRVQKSGAGVLHLHVIGKAMHLDFRTVDGDGWTIDVARGDLLEEPDTARVANIAKAFSPHGSRLFKALKAGCGAQMKPGTGAPWLGVEKLEAQPGEIGASPLERGTVLLMDSVQVERGFIANDRVEYFLSKAVTEANTSAFGPLLGVLQFITTSVTEQKWKAVHKGSALPYVLTPEAVLAKAMPGEGQSALPATLEKLVPAASAYWLKKGEEARALRDGLVESGYFSADNLMVVDGQLQRLTKQLFLTLPPDAAAPASQLPEPLRKLASVLPTTDAAEILIVSKLDAESLTTADDLAELIVIQPKESPIDLALFDRISKLRADVLVQVVDTPATRKAVEKVGEAFTFPLTMPGQLLAASFPVADLPGMERVNKEIMPAPPDNPAGAPHRPSGHPLSTPPPIGKVAKFMTGLAAEGRTIRLAKESVQETPATEDTPEERFVLGVVLEPDVIDSQKDTYSEEEIRKAAHTWMADYRMLGKQHSERADDKMKILESYIAPVDMTIGTTKIAKGTWLLGCRIVDDQMWEDVKEGKITGWSIGGSAIRTPDPSAEGLPVAAPN